MQNVRRKLNYSDVGYHGKPIKELTREELMEAFLRLSQRVYDCAAEGNKCREVILIIN